MLKKIILNKKEVANNNEPDPKPKTVQKITTIKSKPISPLEFNKEREK